MKSSAGLSGHFATDRSRICETGIVSKSASQRTPGGYDLIQGATGMTYSHLRERTAWAYVAATCVRAQGEVDTTGPSANCQLAAAHVRSRRRRSGGSD